MYDLSPSFGAERSSAHIHAGVERVTKHSEVLRTPSIFSVQDRVVSKRDQSEAGTLMSRTGSVLSSVLLRRRADSASVAPSDSASALGRPSIPPFLEAGSLYLSVPPTPSRGSVVSVSALPLTANAGARFGSSSLSVPLNVKLVRESADPLASLPATRAGSTSSLFPGHPQARHGEKDTLPPRSRAASVVGESALRGLPASRMMSMSSLRPDDPFQGAFPYVLSRGDSGMSSTRSSLK